MWNDAKPNEDGVNMDETSKIKPGETDPPTAAERAEWARLCEAATPAPWVWELGQIAHHPRPDCTESVAQGFDLDADCVLVCAARNALPALLTALDAAEQRAERAETRATGLEVAWRNTGAAAESERVRANKLETERDALLAERDRLAGDERLKLRWVTDSVSGGLCAAYRDRVLARERSGNVFVRDYEMEVTRKDPPPQSVMADLAVVYGFAPPRELAERDHSPDAGKKVAAEPSGRAPDPVNHPAHYCSHASGVECIQVTEHLGFCVGNAIKYLWRCDAKGGVEDLRKAAWYVAREITRREKGEAAKGASGEGRT